MKSLSELKNQYQKTVTKHGETAFALNYDLAEHPEISGEEFNSCKKYVQICRANHMEVEENFCGLPTAFRARAIIKKDAKYKMAVLAEYDALPNLGHGCGHSASGSLSLLTVLALQDMADELNAEIDIIGTPDEELRGDKVKMAEDGIFKKYDFAMMIHLNSNITMPSLKFLALGVYKYAFKGLPAHASANPWDGKNALNGVQLMLHAMDMARQHVLPTTRIASFIKHGGEASNVVPEYAEIEACLRSPSRDYLQQVIAKVDACAKGASVATETTYTKEQIGNATSDMLLNEHGIDVIRSVLDELHEPYQEDDGTFCGSSDIGNVSYECPAFHPMLATSDYPFSLHSQDMVNMVKSEKAKEIITRGAMIMGYTMLTLMHDEQLMKTVKEEFLLATQGQKS